MEGNFGIVHAKTGVIIKKFKYWEYLVCNRAALMIEKHRIGKLFSVEEIIAMTFAQAKQNETRETETKKVIQFKGRKRKIKVQ